MAGAALPRFGTPRAAAPSRFVTSRFMRRIIGGERHQEFGAMNAILAIAVTASRLAPHRPNRPKPTFADRWTKVGFE